MQTVVETPAFLASAKSAGLTGDERAAIVDAVARRPDAGDVIPGSGGARKRRFAGRGKGKSGGFRVISYFAASDVPVFLLAVYGKGQKINLTMAELKELKDILPKIAAEWRVKRRAPQPSVEEESAMTATAKRSGSRILQGAREALAYARGEGNLSQYVVHVPQAIDVRAIRQKLALTQTEFARLFNLNVARLRDWEQGRSAPDGAVRAYLLVIDREPDAVRRALRDA